MLINRTQTNNITLGDKTLKVLQVKRLISF